MGFKYSGNEKTVLERLQIAHEPSISKIRANFFDAESRFFRQHVREKKILVAGSGLGHDSFELVKYNKEIVGVEFLNDLVRAAQDTLNKRGIKNIRFIHADILDMR